MILRRDIFLGTGEQFDFGLHASGHPFDDDFNLGLADSTLRAGAEKRAVIANTDRALLMRIRSATTRKSCHTEFSKIHRFPEAWDDLQLGCFWHRALTASSD